MQGHSAFYLGRCHLPYLYPAKANCTVLLNIKASANTKKFCSIANWPWSQAYGTSEHLGLVQGEVITANSKASV